MKLSMATKRQVIEKQKSAYKRATKKRKTEIITALQCATDLSRDHLSRLLRDPNRYQKETIKPGRGRKSVYGAAHRELLVFIWALLGFPSSRRLKAAIPDAIRNLERHGHRSLTPDLRAQMLRMSHRTMDRLLWYERCKQRPFGRSTTKPGALLKSQIPIRRGTEWDDAVPGFMEIDLVLLNQQRAKFLAKIENMSLVYWKVVLFVCIPVQRHLLGGVSTFSVIYWATGPLSGFRCLKYAFVILST